MALIVFAVFAPVIGYDFGGFDDDINLARNRRLNPPTLDALRHYWTRPEFDLYVPITYTVWWSAAHVAWTPRADAMGRHLNPSVFHLLNVALHTLSAVVVFQILLRCVGSVRGAFAGAIVFGLHPVQVEPVAWVAGMKDVLAGLLALVAVWQYVRAGETSDAGARRRVGAWIIGTVAFVLAMLAKPGAVVVPAIALVLDWLVVGRPLRAAVVRALPWFALAVPFIILTRIVQPAPFIGEAIRFRDRPLIATDALAFYLYKLAWPVRLGVDYGRTPQVAIARGWIYVTWILPVFVGAIIWMQGRRAPLLVAGLAVFIVALSPVLAIVPFDFQAYSTVADHYLYLPMLGVALAAGGWIATLRPRRAMLAIVLLVAGALAVLSILQLRHWRDADAIYTHALRVNPQSWAAHARLAEHWAELGDYDRAIAHGRHATAMKPEAWPVHRRLGEHLAHAGRIDEAVAAYRAALALAPADAAANTNLANLLADQGRFEEAIAHYETALDKVPFSVIIHTNIGLTYEQMDRFDEAARHFQRALEINPAAAGDARDGLTRVRAETLKTGPASE